MEDTSLRNCKSSPMSFIMVTDKLTIRNSWITLICHSLLLEGYIRLVNWLISLVIRHGTFKLGPWLAGVVNNSRLNIIKGMEVFSPAYWRCMLLRLEVNIIITPISTSKKYQTILQHVTHHLTSNYTLACVTAQTNHGLFSRMVISENVLIIGMWMKATDLIVIVIDTD
jgi:hypothetical protein